MKTKYLILLFSVIFFTSCVDDEESTPNTPKAEVPTQYAKKLLYGSFSMTQFWSHSGQYLGNGFELSVAFNFTKEGTFEKYFIAQTREYGCVTQALSYSKGTVVFDEANKTFTIYPHQ